MSVKDEDNQFGAEECSGPRTLKKKDILGRTLHATGKWLMIDFFYSFSHFLQYIFSGGSSKDSGKRPLTDESSSDDEPEPKRQRTDEKEFNEKLMIEESNLPDEALSDMMVLCFKYHSDRMEYLSLAGCAITDKGLRELIRYTPALKHLDVTDTHITESGIREAQAVLTDCKIVSHHASSSA